MEFIAQLLLELLIQTLAELLVELGAHGFSGKRPRLHPALAFFVYVTLGGIIGGLSCLVFPQRFLDGSSAYTNLLVTPLLAGGLMSLLGAWRAGRGKQRTRLDHFLYGYSFALAFALTRFFLSAPI